MRGALLGLALVLGALVVLTGAHIIYDETLWTKSDEWPQQRLDPGIWERLNPSDEAMRQPELRAALQKSAWNSLDGPTPRRAVTTPWCGARARGAARRSGVQRSGARAAAAGGPARGPLPPPPPAQTPPPRSPAAAGACGRATRRAARWAPTSQTWAPSTRPRSRWPAPCAKVGTRPTRASWQQVVAAVARSQVEELQLQRSRRPAAADAAAASPRLPRPHPHHPQRCCRTPGTPWSN
jgi:hypothetical protein